MRALRTGALVAAGIVGGACIGKSIDHLDAKVEKRIGEIKRAAPQMAAKSADKVLDKVEERVSDWWDTLQRWLGVGGGIYALGRSSVHLRGHLRKRRAAKRKKR